MRTSKLVHPQWVSAGRWAWGRLGPYRSHMKVLRATESTPARLLELIILRAVRSDAVRCARFCEFDLVERVWTIPKSQMKRLRRDQRIPLGDRALQLVKRMRDDSDSEFVLQEQVVARSALLVPELLGTETTGAVSSFLSGAPWLACYSSVQIIKRVAAHSRAARQRVYVVGNPPNFRGIDTGCGSCQGTRKWPGGSTTFSISDVSDVTWLGSRATVLMVSRTVCTMMISTVMARTRPNVIRTIAISIATRAHDTPRTASALQSCGRFPHRKFERAASPPGVASHRRTRVELVAFRGSLLGRVENRCHQHDRDG
jgi:hypothetical protein